MKNGFMIAALLCSSSLAFAANSGEASLEKAKNLLGESALRGETLRGGQDCELSFDGSRNGVLMGEQVIGTYKLTVQNGRSLEFYFIQGTEVQKEGGATVFVTTQHSDADDSPDEGGFHPAHTDVMKLQVSSQAGKTLVKINNAIQVSCTF
jgi:hypothetical protein